MDSPRNPRIVAARALHAVRGRREAGAFLAEGAHAVQAALDSAFVVREVFVTDHAAQREVEVMRALAKRDVVIHTVTDRALRAVGETTTPQGVVAVVASPAAPEVADHPRLGVVLHQCADPGNAGTVIRTADAAGADLVAFGDGSVDVWSGKSVRASAGSVFHLPLVVGRETRAVVEELRAAGCQILATTATGDGDLDQLTTTDALASPTAWLFGSEAHGLPDDLLDLADRVVRIPIHGRAESLNLAAAAAVCLYASARAQRLAGTS
ncbi:MAG TPA: RNA methyltransferase [Mycobacteriales bacterium]|nr:RNA methyltransferase [Mycobacteriales bacterium]